MFVSLLLLFQFENLVRHNHCLVAAAFITRTRNVEERVVQGDDRVVTLPVSFATDCAVMILLMLMVLLDLSLLLVADCLLAAVTGRLRFTRIQVEAEVRGGSITR